MRCRTTVVLLFLSIGAAAQTLTSQSRPVRDSQGLSLLRQSVTAMSNGGSVSDITLTGTATRIAGSDQQSGQLVLKAKGTLESKIALSLSGYTFSEVRNYVNGSGAGSYVGPDGILHVTAQQNCFIDPAWFSPMLSSLASAVSSPGINVSYLGTATLNGSAVQHVATWQSISSPDSSAALAIAHLSTMDWYLDASTSLPIAVRFTTHPADDASKDFAVEVRFSAYQPTNGVLIPFHVQKFLNGGLVLDLTISSAVLNSGLSDSDFTLQ